MLKYLIIAAMFLLAGCSPDRVILSKLRESEWYKSQSALAHKKNRAAIRFEQAYIAAGKIKEIRYNFEGKKLEELSISPVRYLETPSLWEKWFGDTRLRLWANGDKFRKDNFPALDEYWAFEISKGIKGGYSIKSAVRLIYDADTESLKIIGKTEEELIR